MEKSTSNKALFIVAGACSVILVVLVLLTTILSMQKNTLTATTAGSASNTTSQTPSNDVGQKMVSQDSLITPNGEMPRVTIENWNIPVAYTSQKQTASLYTFKQFLTIDDATALASQLHVNGEVKASGSIVYASEVDKAAKVATLFTYNLHSGAFHYVTNKSLIEQKIQPSQDDYRTKTLDLVKALGFNDPTLAVSATYKDKNTPGRTYIELHRDWNLVGKPILNSVGLANLPETQKISQLTVNSTVTDMEENADIYNTSDQKDGLARQNDFNTMTLGVDDATGDVLSINSNIRPFQTAPSEQMELISFDDAQKKLQANRYEFLLTTPAGAGDTPWTRIYPGNSGLAKRATVTETTVAYLENPATISQKYLIPYYVFRGYANLTSGYLVEFIATVPAIDSNPQASNGWLVKDVFAAAIDTPNSDKGQKQSTFDMTPAPTPTDMPVDTTSCVPPTSQLNPVYTVNGVQFGWSNVKLYQGKLTTSRKGFWYYIPSGSASNFQNDVNQVITQVKSMIGETDFREFDKILEDYQLKGASCPVRVTGASPSLFIYGNIGDTVSLKPATSSIYSDPATTDTGMWNVTVNKHNLTVNGVDRPYIYYEYDKQNVRFARPATGIVTNKVYLNKTADHIADLMKLTSAEKERLLFEISHAAASVSGDQIFVGVINETELESQIPLNVSQGYGVTRIHMYVGAAKPGEITNEHSFTPINRSSHMILELGSYAGN